MARSRRLLSTLWMATLGLVVLALLGSVWAAFFTRDCASCGGTAGSASGRALSQAGVAYYALLFGAGLIVGRSRVVWSGILLAASVHGVLLVILVTRREFCPPCVVAGLAAVGAAALSCFIDPYNLARASVILPGAALATQLSAFALGAFSGPAVPGVQALPEPAQHWKAGTVKMVVYERPDCVYCQRLRSDVLPGLTLEFGRRLDVEHRSAEGMPGLPTPTILLTGAGGRRSYPGLPSSEVLRQAILETLGELHDRQAMLPASR